MIQHHCTDDLVHLSIDKKNFAHRIPLQKIGKAIQWNIGPKGPDGIIIRNVSRWTLRLFTQQFTDESYLDDFKAIGNIRGCLSLKRLTQIHIPFPHIS